MKKLILFFFLLLIRFLTYGQELHILSPGEKSMMPGYLISRSAAPSGITTPPSSPVRTIAEWEELQALMIGWKSYPTMLRDIVRAAKAATRVIIVFEAPDNVTSLTNYLLAGGVDTVNVTFLPAPLNSVWSRDYGPWSAYTNEVDSLLTIDWVYNRPRYEDDTVPAAIANWAGTPLYETAVAPWRLVHTGGNFMTDGRGTGFSSELIVNENPGLTVADIDTIMKRFMGIDRYIKMGTLTYDVIHHIDMHMKLLDEETILMGQYPQGVADGPDIEANLLYVLSNFNSIYGTPYKVIRIPMPPDNGLYPNNGGDYFTYTNSSFVNGTIIVPTYNIPQDSLALAIYRQALPGYTVTGINSLASIGALGALHCITKEIATNDPLLISHQKLTNTSDTVNPFPVSAYIRHRSGIQSAYVYWRTDTLLPWQSLPMSAGTNHQFTASIPPQPSGTRVYYYIAANGVSGKSANRPLPAPVAYWAFDIGSSTGLSEATSFSWARPAFPNPARGLVCIPVTIHQPGDYRLELHDLSGRLVYEKSYTLASTGEQQLFIDVSGYPAAIYSLKVTHPSGFRLTKIAVR